MYVTKSIFQPISKITVNTVFLGLNKICVVLTNSKQLTSAINQVPLRNQFICQCDRSTYFMRLIQSGFLMVFLLCASFGFAKTAESAENLCAVSSEASGSLSTARDLFRNSCPTSTLIDCDPILGGGWQCSSALINADAPLSEQVATTNTRPPPNNTSECYAVARGLDQSKLVFTRKCENYERSSCNPIGDNLWVCSSANVSVTSRHSKTSIRADNRTDNSRLSGTSNIRTSKPALITTKALAISVFKDTDAVNGVDNNRVSNTRLGRLAPNDLLVLHYDNCPDKDDGHAIPAGKSVVEKYDINNVLAVNGTCGNSIRIRFNPASNAVMNASWGTEFLDASGQRAAALQHSVTRWAEVLANGASVWVAEGGQSDFTADVVREIETRYSNIDLKRIHVIQHSTGPVAYNEKFTDNSNLNYLKSNVSYQAIANGNIGGNGSANLNQQSFYFVSTAQASRFSAEWNAGFAYLQPDCSIRTENCKLDFSDTVGLLYIVDDKDTRNVNDFANKYLN